jgi:hypothetical protein
VNWRPPGLRCEEPPKEGGLSVDRLVAHCDGCAYLSCPAPPWARAINIEVFEDGIADAPFEWVTANLTGDDDIEVKQRL